VFDNGHSLHLWKRHTCTSTVERQLTDWCEQVTTWRDLRGLLYSHRDIMCLLIQSNCIEFQLSINILIWVAWLFDHPVFAYLISAVVIYSACSCVMLSKESFCTCAVHTQSTVSIVSSIVY
jgi:hypothetical protein